MEIQPYEDIVLYANKYKTHLKKLGPPKDQVVFILDQIAFYLQEQHGLETYIKEDKPKEYVLIIKLDRATNVDQMNTFISCIESTPHSYDTETLKIYVFTLGAALYVQGTINSIY